MKIIKIIQYTGTILIGILILGTILIDLLGYEIYFVVFNGYLDNVLCILALVLLLIIFLLVTSLIRTRGQGLALRSFIGGLMIFLIMFTALLYGLDQDMSVLKYNTPYDDTLIFAARCTVPSFHHPEYQTTIYQEVYPGVYKKLGVVRDFERFFSMDDFTPESGSYIDYYDTGFTLHYVVWSDDGISHSYEQSFTYAT